LATTPSRQQQRLLGNNNAFWAETSSYWQQQQHRLVSNTGLKAEMRQRFQGIINKASSVMNNSNTCCSNIGLQIFSAGRTSNHQLKEAASFSKLEGCGRVWKEAP